MPFPTRLTVVLAGKVQHHAGRQQLVFAQAVAVLFGRDQQAHRVVAWLGTVVGDQLAEVVGQPLGSIVAGFDDRPAWC